MLPNETLSTLRRVKGMRFDYENAIMLFPLTEHDNLQVALAAIRIIVEPLPRSVIAAVQLSHKRDNPSRVVDYDNNSSSVEPIDIQKALEEKAEATDKVLLTKINEKLLKALAPFQREGVLFTVNNNGRALIADEMGLGGSHRLHIDMHNPHTDYKIIHRPACIPTMCCTCTCSVCIMLRNLNAVIIFQLTF